MYLFKNKYLHNTNTNRQEKIATTFSAYNKCDKMIKNNGMIKMTKPYKHDIIEP